MLEIPSEFLGLMFECVNLLNRITKQVVVPERLLTRKWMSQKFPFGELNQAE